MAYGNKGRPRFFDGKINIDNLDLSGMEKIEVEGAKGRLATQQIPIR